MEGSSEAKEKHFILCSYGCFSFPQPILGYTESFSITFRVKIKYSQGDKSDLLMKGDLVKM